MDDKEYRDILLKIVANLLNKNVEAIKFYYSQQIGDAHLKRIKTPIELIQTLEQCMLLGIDNYDDFVEVLTKIGRNDLANHFSNDRFKEKDNKKFNEVLMNVTCKLKDEDVEKIKLFYSGQIDLNYLEEIKTPYDLIQTLKQCLALSIKNYEGFVVLLAKISRNDLAKQFFNLLLVQRIRSISIEDEKSSDETYLETAIVNYVIESGEELLELHVHKNILSDEEKNLIIQCSTSVCDVNFYCPIKFEKPIKFEEWKPKGMIKRLMIHISPYLIKEKEFEVFLPWINHCKELLLFIHNDVDFIIKICEWIRSSSVEEFEIDYHERGFKNLNDLENYFPIV